MDLLSLYRQKSATYLELCHQIKLFLPNSSISDNIQAAIEALRRKEQPSLFSNIDHNAIISTAARLYLQLEVIEELLREGGYSDQTLFMNCH